MATLTQTAIITRKVIRYSIYGIIFLTIARVVLGIVIWIYTRLFPPPPPPPTVAFGKLPKLAFPEKGGLPQFEYTLETAEGDFPNLTTQAKVYYMPKSSSHLLSLDVAKQKAASLGFNSEPEEVSQSVYKFQHGRVPSTLEMNIVTGVFSISYNLSSDPSPLGQLPPPPEVAASSARSFLSSGDILPADLTGQTSHEFLKIEGKSLVPAISLSEADLVKINLFRKAYEEIPSLTSNPNQANVWFLISGATQREKQIVAGEFHYFPVDEGQSSTYPLKTASQAFEDLKAGKGYIANLGLNEDGKVVVRKIDLGYYDPGKETEFFQPIIVFEGDRGFMAYVSAVSAEYYEE